MDGKINFPTAGHWHAQTKYLKISLCVSDRLATAISTFGEMWGGKTGRRDIGRIWAGGIREGRGEKAGGDKLLYNP